MPQSTGLVMRRDFRAVETAPPVQRLIDAGAIPLGVTNTSELSLWIESTNQVYGCTNNPYDPDRTAGGSSGGEGAAVGSGASPFGVGSDIGGSIRVPAFFCGVFGHKPSPGLVPNTGHYPPTAGRASEMLATGPLVRRAEDLMPLLSIMAGPDGVDSCATAMTIGDPASVSLAELQLVTVEHASLLPMSRALRDARERAIGALVSAGATVRRIALRSWRSAALPFLATLQASAERQLTALLIEAGAAAPTWRGLARRGGPHTLPTRLTLATELLPGPGGSSRRRAAGGCGEPRLRAQGSDRRRRPAAPGVPAYRAAPRKDGGPPVAADAFGGVQPGRCTCHRGAAGAHAARAADRRPGGGIARARPSVDCGRARARARVRRLGPAAGAPCDDRDEPHARRDGDPDDGDRAWPRGARATRVSEPRSRRRLRRALGAGDGKAHARGARRRVRGGRSPLRRRPLLRPGRGVPRRSGCGRGRSSPARSRSARSGATRTPPTGRSTPIRPRSRT